MQLIDCAVQSLSEGGFVATSIAEVARRAGVSKGVVTYHFPTKDVLLRAVVTALYDQAGSQIGAEVATAPAALDALVRYIEANLGLAPPPAPLGRAALELAATRRRGDGEAALTPTQSDPVAAHLQGLIQQGVDNGEFASVDAAMLAMIIRAAIDTAAAHTATVPAFNPHRFERELVRLVRTALGARS